MNYTTGSIPNCEAVPDIAVQPTCSGLPPLGETMRKTCDTLLNCNALADSLLEFICRHDAEKRPDPQPDCLQEASLANCDLAVSVMHKLELALSVLGA